MTSPNPSFTPTKTIVLTGMMGAGKTCTGRRLAERLGLPFMDADTHIAEAAGCSISEIFERHGEEAFRDGERRVISRLLGEPVHVLAVGGGAFMDPKTRVLISQKALSVWLRADVDLLLSRVLRRNTRPLLKTGNPREVLEKLVEERYPVYAEANVIVDSVDAPPEVTVEKTYEALAAFIKDNPLESQKASMSTMDRVRVELEERSYEILVGSGLLQQAGEHLAPLLKQPRVVIVTDDNVAPLHLETLETSLSAAAIDHSSTILPHGERTKDFAHLERLVEQILEDKVERGTTLIALGGGVIGDITGFAASIILRGVNCVQAPTTLLSQGDSSVGGKTGINSSHGKNLIGSFYQPRIVLADIATLDTLPQREFLAGYAETVKYGLINDPDFFSWLEENGAALCAGDPALRQQAVVNSCQAKAAIVSADEKEVGARALLNLGHTFAHALEAEAGYGDALIHGEAVAIGMQLAFDFSVRLKLCSAVDSERVARHFEAVGLPTNLSDIAGSHWTPQTLITHMTHDKKVRDGKITFVLTKGIGQAFLTAEVDMKELESTLENALSP